MVSAWRGGFHEPVPAAAATVPSPTPHDVRELLSATAAPQSGPISLRVAICAGAPPAAGLLGSQPPVLARRGAFTACCGSGHPYLNGARYQR